MFRFDIDFFEIKDFFVIALYFVLLIFNFVEKEGCSVMNNNMMC